MHALSWPPSLSPSPISSSSPLSASSSAPPGDEAASPCGIDVYPWQRAYRQAAGYADRFMTRGLGHQAKTEGWSHRLHSYVQIAAWRQLCSGAAEPEVIVPAACVEHWRLAWVHGVYDNDAPDRVASPARHHPEQWGCIGDATRSGGRS